MRRYARAFLGVLLMSSGLSCAASSPHAESSVPTGITRADYLRLIAGNVDYFKTCQNAEGAIIDPVSHGERQYSTPAFAAAAGLLVRHAGRNDLREPAERAFTWAVASLVEHRAADNHADFYAPLLIHAFRSLKSTASPGLVAAWEKQLRAIDPEKTYRADLRGMNWNVVSSCGELLRRNDGLVDPARLDAQMKYLEACLAGHMKTLTPLGLFEDPHSPMAYDAFARLWLEDAMADGAYDGAHHAQIADFLAKGELATLKLLSPSGEWASGGRSALHNWNEAEVAVICEIGAARRHAAGDAATASQLKRAAHLALKSMFRWQRPTGELWVVKNRAEPDARFGYETYSHHSQYNLLPMAMLAIAYERADESIPEHPTPAETGGYILDARTTFHKVVAAAGGYYVLIDTDADPHYNATGLQRVHRAGVPFPALSDTACADRAYEPKDAPMKPLGMGLQWQTSAGWQSLATTAQTSPAALHILRESPDHAEFEVIYTLAGNLKLTERYTVVLGGVTVTDTLEGLATTCRAAFPVLIDDAREALVVDIQDATCRIDNHGSITRVEVSDALGPLALDGATLVTHSGHVRTAVAAVKGSRATFHIVLHG